MNILFLTLVNISSFEERHNIYADLCREMVNKGNTVHIVCPIENRSDAETHFEPFGEKSGILKVRTGKIQKTNIIRKGIETILASSRYKNAIKKHLNALKYDMIVYSTPPITLVNVVKFLKKRDNAVTYLLLKDIFPQNAVDLHMMSKTGAKSIVYRYFRYKENQLYQVSDCIGCMSPNNVSYLLENNPQIPTQIVHVSPNSFDPSIEKRTADERVALREKYGLPIDKKIFIYGGNLGKPQGVPFIIECMKLLSEYEKAYFVICGNGTEYGLLEDYVAKSQQKNLKLISGLPRDEYEAFVGCCDVGLIFLDFRFTIPNFPSRLLSYMQKSLPVLACTDRATDIGSIIEKGGFGWSCMSANPMDFVHTVNKAMVADTEKMGMVAAQYLIENYSAKDAVEIIFREYERAKQ